MRQSNSKPKTSAIISGTRPQETPHQDIAGVKNEAAPKAKPAGLKTWRKRPNFIKCLDKNAKRGKTKIRTADGDCAATSASIKPEIIDEVGTRHVLVR